MLSKGLFILIFLITLTTSWVAASKLVKNLSQEVQSQTVKTEVLGKQVLSPTPSIIQKNNTQNSISQKNPGGTNNKSIASTLNQVNRLLPSISPTRPYIPPITNTPTLIPTAIPNTGCIITLFGNQYDVATLRQTHSGGNVFNCGTDMTSVYQGKHGSNVSQMQGYLVTGGGSVQTTPSGGVNPTNPPRNRGDDDDDD